MKFHFLSLIKLIKSQQKLFERYQKLLNSRVLEKKKSDKLHQKHVKKVNLNFWVHFQNLMKANCFELVKNNSLIIKTTPIMINPSPAPTN